MPVLPEPVVPVLAPPPLVPVAACSLRHFVRSSPVSVSHRPLLLPAGAGPGVAPLAPTLVVPVAVVVSEERGAVVPAEPAVSALVPVDGVVALMPESERMLEPDWVCAKPALENARSAAAVAVQRVLSSIV